MPRCNACVRGFTLVELAVAVVVFAILATLALPAFATYFEKARLRAAADAVVALVADARASAVKQARAVSVRSVGEGASWCVGAREAPLPEAGLPMGAALACDCSGVGDTGHAGDACVVDARRAVVSSGGHEGVVLVAPIGALAFDGTTGLRMGGGGAAMRLASHSGRFALTIAVSPLGHASVCSTGGAMLGVSPC
jgi:prepilin-type N-terminal cleavage/methylation domain-containing protein